MSRIRLVQADITTLDVDAIVNAANDHLWMGAGVAGAIKRAGGDEIEREAVAQGPIAIGEAVVTGAGRLAARHVIHAATMGQDLATDERSVRAATANALRRAEEHRLRSVAFPALGTGVGGFPVERCAEVMLEETRRHLARGSSIEDVFFVLRGQGAFDAFARALGGETREWDAP
jgi:O-acetyl-ADP-ribose deacetylase (regulator of RNase III)